VPLPHAWPPALSLVALLAACTPATPTPIVGQTLVATPTPTLVVTAPVAQPPPVAVPVVPADPSAPWTTLPEGIVPRALLQDVSLAPSGPPLLVRADKCDAPALGGDCNYGPTAILGFNTETITLVFAPESGHPDVWPLVGEIVDLDGRSRERRTITRTGELEGHEYKSARLKGWKWFNARRKAGDRPPRPLLWASGATGSDEAQHAPLVFLRAPLAGWMLYLEVPTTGDEMTLQLVTPDNNTTHRLATLPIQTAGRCRDESGDLGKCTRPLRLDLADIDAVALDPARAHMVVLYTLRAVGGSAHTRWAVHPLPDGVQPTP